MREPKSTTKSPGQRITARMRLKSLPGHPRFATIGASRETRFVNPSGAVRRRLPKTRGCADSMSEHQENATRGRSCHRHRHPLRRPLDSHLHGGFRRRGDQDRTPARRLPEKLRLPERRRLAVVEAREPEQEVHHLQHLLARGAGDPPQAVRERGRPGGELPPRHDGAMGPSPGRASMR